MRCGRSRRALARRLLPVFVRRQNTPIHLPIRAKTQKFPHNKNRTDKS